MKHIRHGVWSLDGFIVKRGSLGGMNSHGISFRIFRKGVKVSEAWNITEAKRWIASQTSTPNTSGDTATTPSSKSDQQHIGAMNCGN